MTTAIRLNDSLSVIVTFHVTPLSQMTSHELQNVEQITARIYSAEGLKLLGEGISIRQPEDAEDDEKGAKLALTRAVEDASVFGGMTKDARRVIYHTFIDVFQQEKLNAWLEAQTVAIMKLIEAPQVKPAHGGVPYETPYEPPRLRAETEEYGWGI